MNITVSMDDETARWVRVEAAKAGKSVSRWLGDILAERRSGGAGARHEAMRAFLATGPRDLGFYGTAPSREEMNERESLHRHQRADLREGSDEPFQAEGRSSLADSARERRRRRPKPTKPT
jgi:hypothetical protein